MNLVNDFLMNGIFFFFLLSCTGSTKSEVPSENEQNQGAFAPPHGDTVGNGGSIVINGVEYHLADLYFKPHVGNTFTFSGPLKDRLELLQKLLPYWSNQSEEYHSYFRQFFAEHIFNELVQFKFVAELPDYCHDPMEVEPQFAPIQFACTAGYLTWIIPEYFTKLRLEERAAAILHERLHAWAPDQPHDVISPFVKGAVVFQDAYQAFKEKRPLTKEEIKVLKMMRFSQAQLGLANLSYYKDWDIYPYGGAAVKNVSQNDEVWLSVGSTVDSSSFEGKVRVDGSILVEGSFKDSSQISFSVVRNSTILKGGQITNSRLNWSSLGPESKVVTSLVWNLRTGPRALLNASILEGSRESVLGSDVTLDEVTFYGTSGRNNIGSHSIIKRSEIEWFLCGPNTNISDSKLRIVEISGTNVIQGSEVFRVNLSNVTLENSVLLGGGWIPLYSRVTMINSTLRVVGNVENTLVENSFFENTFIKAPNIRISTHHEASRNCTIDAEEEILLFDGCAYASYRNMSN